MSKASESHTLNLSRRHLTVGAAIRDEVRRVRHQLRREAQRNGKRAWLAAAASGLCLMMAAPMLAPSPAQAAALVCSERQQLSDDGTVCLGKAWTDVAAPADGMTPGAVICVWGRPAKVIAAPVTAGREGFDAVTVAFTHGKVRGAVFMTLHRRGHPVDFAPRCAGRGF